MRHLLLYSYCQRHISAFLLLGLIVLLGACNKKQQDQEQTGNQHQVLSVGETYVDTMILHLQSFNNQIVCNGRLRAISKSDLSFSRSGMIRAIHVKEGQYITKGTLIASIEKRDKQREIERATHEVERARVSFVDKLIGLGYDVKDVPDDIRQRVEVTSGYYNAKYQLQTAQTALDECDLYAPFSGRIANITAKVHQTSDRVCTLIDDSEFNVEFKVLEAELSHIKIGSHVNVSPFINDSLICTGTIREINPIVDDRGLVRVIARINGGNKELIDGLNMRIIVNGEAKDMYVVPKDAVVERDGYHVIFLLKDGVAVWTYVDILHSNINSFAISGSKRKETTISDGDVVITSGNLNLADGTEVKVRGSR